MSNTSLNALGKFFKNRDASLFAAAESGQSLGALANLANFSARNEQGHSVMHVAAMADNHRALSELCARGRHTDARDINQVNEQGKTALALAAELGHEKSVGALLDSKQPTQANPLVRDQIGNTAVHLAAGSGRVASIEAMKPWVGLAGVNQMGQSVSDVAYAKGHMETVKAVERIQIQEFTRQMGAVERQREVSSGIGRQL